MFGTGKLYLVIMFYCRHTLILIVVFDSADLDKFLKASVPLGIWIGILSLSWEILAAIVRSVNARTLAPCVVETTDTTVVENILSYSYDPQQ